MATGVEPGRLAGRLLFVGPVLLSFIGLFWPCLSGRVIGGHVANAAPFRELRLPSDTGAQGDVGGQYLPSLCETQRQLREGQVPLWNPYAGCGAPLLANQQSAILHPFTIAALGVPWRSALLFVVILRWLLAYGGAWLLAHDLRFGICGRAGFACAYALSGSMVAWVSYPIGAVFAHIPLLMYLARRHARRDGLGSGSALLAALVSSILAGHFEYLPIAWLLAACAGAWRAGAGRYRFLARFVGIATASCAVSAVMILPCVEYLGQSQHFERRSQQQADLLDDHRLLTTIVDGALFTGSEGRELLARVVNPVAAAQNYLGCTTLVLVGCAASSRSSRVTVLCLIGALLFLWENPLARLLWLVPPLSWMVPARLFVLVALATALLVGRALDLAAAASGSTVGSLAGATIGGAMLAAEQFLFRGFRTVPSPGRFSYLVGAVVALLLLHAAKGGRLRTVAPALLVAALIVDRSLALRGVIRWDSTDRIFPPFPVLRRLASLAGPDRVLAQGAVLPPNTATVYRIRDPRLYDGIGVGPYVRAVGAEANRGFVDLRRFVPTKFTRESAAVLLIVPDPSRHPRSTPVMRFDRGFSIVRDPDALPRARLASTPRRRDGVAFLQDGSTRIVLDCNLLTADRLVLADVFYPGWEARVDGSCRRVLQEGAFRAVGLERGRHTVEFVYRPMSYRLGLFITLSSLQILTAVALPRCVDRAARYGVSRERRSSKV